MSAVLNSELGFSSVWDTPKPNFRSISEKEITKSPSDFKIGFTEFHSGGKLIISRRAVKVDIVFEKDSILMESESLNIFAYGESFDEALNQFSHHIAYFFEYYLEKKPSEVTGMATKLKEIFNNNFYLAE